MKSLNYVMLWGCAMLFTLGGCATTGESIEMQLAYLPEQQATYQTTVNISTQLTVDIDDSIEPKSKLSTVSHSSQLRLTTSKADENGNITITVKPLTTGILLDGKEQTLNKPPKVQIAKQSPDGKFIVDNKSDAETTAFMTLLNQFNLPEKLFVGKKYPLNVDDEAFNRFFADAVDSSEKYHYDVRSWIKINQANTQSAWGEIHSKFKVSETNDDKPLTISGTEIIQFKYNRHTHLYEEIHDKIKYNLLSEYVKMIFSSVQTTKQL